MMGFSDWLDWKVPMRIFWLDVHYWNNGEETERGRLSRAS